MTGPIPEEIGNSASLRSFSVQQNQITGLIPTVFGSLSSLETLVRTSVLPEQQSKSLGIESNSLTPFILLSQNLFFNIMNGPVPSELGGLTLLENRE